MQSFNFSFDSSACETCGGKCCTGESGYIFCSIDELKLIASFLKLPFNDFTQKYVKKVGYKYSLIEKPDIQAKSYACIFFDTTSRKCQIYPIRPKQCQTFPFWDSFLDRNSQEFRSLIEMCKGVKIDKKDN